MGSGRGQKTATSLPGSVSVAPSAATNTASRLAGSVSLAFSLTRCVLPGGSKKLSPALYNFHFAAPAPTWLRIAPLST